jgi:hypothetical protein
MTVTFLNRDSELLTLSRREGQSASHSVNRGVGRGRSGGVYRNIRTCVAMRDPRSRSFRESVTCWETFVSRRQPSATGDLRNILESAPGGRRFRYR